jgi:ABC-type nickel/cobalt efflux system permease component RcnA
MHFHVALFGNQHEMWPKQHNGKVRVLRSRMEAREHMTRYRDRLRRNLDQKDSLLKTFKISLGLTAGSISFSMLALVIAELIARWGIWCVVILIVGLLLFVACLCSYIVLIQKAIE